MTTQKDQRERETQTTDDTQKKSLDEENIREEEDVIQVA
jgi:hypothetical protein